jgi:hypothetical protein
MVIDGDGHEVRDWHTPKSIHRQFMYCQHPYDTPDEGSYENLPLELHAWVP